MEVFDIYKDIDARTNGEIYLGVVGPVRTGKSTFIKRFMDLMVLPKIADLSARERAIDELPQSASGRTVMTTEPKFVPKEAANISLADDVNVKIKLVDCVGYMVEGATGHMEEGEERKVKTPWFDYEIPFTKLFYKFIPPTPSKEIFNDLKEMEKEETSLMKELFSND